MNKSSSAELSIDKVSSPRDQTVDTSRSKPSKAKQDIITGALGVNHMSISMGRKTWLGAHV